MKIEKNYEPTNNQQQQGNRVVWYIRYGRPLPSSFLDITISLMIDDDDA
jgi:hypothetical protein